ncbi:hypothetical protein C8R47DRAFT_1220146 [Mycena vitilis]|nr:hypothetical protein C8R47DRAFT_1220146 [Mycena vitilis]
MPPPQLILESERMEGSPHLSLALSASTPYISISDDLNIDITATLTYHAEPNDRPIVFRKEFDAKYALLTCPDEGSTGESPEEIIEKELCEFGAWPWDSDPEVKTIPIADESLFQSLAPGESTQIAWCVFDGYSEDFQLGRRYTFQYVGGVITWWDWGTAENHKDEWVGLYENSHDARPRIVIPASNALEFLAVE